MSLSRDTLELCLAVLKGTNLNGNAPDFEEVALKVVTARRELAAELAKQQE